MEWGCLRGLCIVPWASASPHHKRHLNRFSQFRACVWLPSDTQADHATCVAICHILCCVYVAWYNIVCVNAGGDDWWRIYGGVWSARSQRDATLSRDCADGHHAAQRRSIFQNTTSTSWPTQASHRYPFRCAFTMPSWITWSYHEVIVIFSSKTFSLCFLSFFSYAGYLCHNFSCFSVIWNAC